MLDLDEDFSGPVRAKARRLLDTERHKVTPDSDRDTIWWVVGSNNITAHRVQFGDGWVTCTCTHGGNNGGDAHCYHVASVLMLTEKIGDDE